MNIVDKSVRKYFGGRRGAFHFLGTAAVELLLRRYSKFGVLPQRVERVVFVCKGNICRSALAEAVFKVYSSRKVASLGLDTTTGCPAHPPFIQAAKALGYNLGSHTTTNITDFIAEDNDLYVCTEPAHIAQLRVNMTNINVVLLGFWGKPLRLYVHDPYSADVSYISYISRFLERATQRFAKDLEGNFEFNVLE